MINALTGKRANLGLSKPVNTVKVSNAPKKVCNNGVCRLVLR